MRLRSLALAATVAALAAGPAAAAEEAALPHLPWSFDGLFGTFLHLLAECGVLPGYWPDDCYLNVCPSRRGGDRAAESG